LKGKYLHADQLVINLLCGTVIAFLSSVLIYFKQKPFLHQVVILLASASILFSFYVLKNRIKAVPNHLRIISILLIIIVAWLGPQFLYQIRPHTFYITGYSILLIVAIILASQLNQRTGKSTYFDYLALIIGYLLGRWISIEILPYIVVGLLVVFLTIFIVQMRPGFKLTLLLIFAFALGWQLHFHFSKPMDFFAEQKDYEDKVLFTSETQFHKLVITQWQDEHWFFIDKLKNICSIDEYLFYEPMVHGAMGVAEDLEEVLVLGGENGCLIRELLKYNEVRGISVVSYDSVLRSLGTQNPYFTSMNQNASKDSRVKLVKGDLLEFVSGNSKKYDIIFIDLPDPRSIETNQFYTLEFYNMLKHLLNKKAIVVTQAGSPYFATQAFYSIAETLKEVGFEVLPIHNQILTLGEWGWYICSLEKDEETMRNQVIYNKTPGIETMWWNDEAAKLVTSFGKTYSDTFNVGVNTLDNPVVYQYYLKGNWDME